MTLYVESKDSRERMTVLAKEVEEFVNTQPSLHSSSLASKVTPPSNTTGEPVHALVPGLKAIEHSRCKSHSTIQISTAKVAA